MGLTTRQKAYQRYLRSEHWTSLRSAALARDGGKCAICGETDTVQVHHLKYRGRFEDSLLEDLETLCRKHHRLEHGLGPTDFESQYRIVRKYFGYQERPPVEEWKELKRLISCPEDLQDFGELMCQWVMFVVSHEQEGFAPDWWMDKAKNDRWTKLAWKVRDSLWERAF